MTPVRRVLFVAGLCCSTLPAFAAAQPGSSSESTAQPRPAPAAAAPAPAPSPGPERLELGAALDSDDGLVGSAYAGKNNLIPGVFTFATLRYARETQRGQAGVFRQGALGANVDAGVDFDYRRDAYDDQGFRLTSYGIEPYLQWRRGRAGTLTAGVGYRVLTVGGIAADAPASFRRDAGTTQGLYAHVAYALDKLVRTKRFTLGVGTDGHLYNLSAGGRAFAQVEGWSRAKLALVPDDLSLLNTIRIGYMHGLGGDAPGIADRFFIGGANLRGFQARHVGPSEGRYFVGGQRYASASVDLVKQVGTVLGSPVSVAAFVDVGSLWGLDAPADAQADAGAKLRASAGLAVTFTVAGVPVSAYVAKPFRKEAQDVEQNFGMSISMRF